MLRKLKVTYVAIVCVGLFSLAASVVTSAPNNFFESGSGRLAIGGGDGLGLEVESGGVINLKSGAALKVAGVDKTSALGAAVTNPAKGIAAGYVLARGETALDGTNPTPVTTGLTAIAACSLAIKTGTAPGVGTSVVTYLTSSGTLNLYGWTVTSNADPTLIASAGTETIGWICVGT